MDDMISDALNKGAIEFRSAPLDFQKVSRPLQELWRIFGSTKLLNRPNYELEYICWENRNSRPTSQQFNEYTFKAKWELILQVQRERN